jgi:hypothetical protein
MEEEVRRWSDDGTKGRRQAVAEASSTYAMYQATILVLGVVRRGQCVIEAGVRSYIRQVEFLSGAV